MPKMTKDELQARIGTLCQHNSTHDILAVMCSGVVTMVRELRPRSRTEQIALLGDISRQMIENLERLDLEDARNAN